MGFIEVVGLVLVGLVLLLVAMLGGVLSHSVRSKVGGDLASSRTKTVARSATIWFAGMTLVVLLDIFQDRLWIAYAIYIPVVLAALFAYAISRARARRDRH